MIGNRFHCKTENMGITTTFVVVVMLLLFSASCSKEHKEVVDVEFDPDKTYTMKATDVILDLRFRYHEISLESERMADLWEGGGTPLVFPRGDLRGEVRYLIPDRSEY